MKIILTKEELELFKHHAVCVDTGRFLDGKCKKSCIECWKDYAEISVVENSGCITGFEQLAKDCKNRMVSGEHNCRECDRRDECDLFSSVPGLWSARDKEILKRLLVR